MPQTPSTRYMYADDPFLIGREVIWQGCDWRDMIFWCPYQSVIPAKTLKFSSFFTVILLVLRFGGAKRRYKPAIGRIKSIRSTCRYQPNRAQSRLVSYWSRAGGVFRWSGRRGLRL